MRERMRENGATVFSLVFFSLVVFSSLVFFSSVFSHDDDDNNVRHLSSPSLSLSLSLEARPTLHHARSETALRHICVVISAAPSSSLEARPTTSRSRAASTRCGSTASPRSTRRRCRRYNGRTDLDRSARGGDTTAVTRRLRPRGSGARRHRVGASAAARGAGARGSHV